MSGKYGVLNYLQITIIPIAAQLVHYTRVLFWLLCWVCECVFFRFTATVVKNFKRTFQKILFLHFQELSTLVDQSLMMMQSHVDGMIQGVPPPEGSNELWELHHRYLGRNATLPLRVFRRNYPNNGWMEEQLLDIGCYIIFLALF